MAEKPLVLLTNASQYTAPGTVDALVWPSDLVFCPGNSLTKSREFLKDGVSSGSPHGGVRICVVSADEASIF